MRALQPCSLDKLAKWSQPERKKTLKTADQSEYSKAYQYAEYAQLISVDQSYISLLRFWTGSSNTWCTKSCLWEKLISCFFPLHMMNLQHIAVCTWGEQKEDVADSICRNSLAFEAEFDPIRWEHHEQTGQSDTYFEFGAWKHIWCFHLRLQFEQLSVRLKKHFVIHEHGLWSSND